MRISNVMDIPADFGKIRRVGAGRVSSDVTQLRNLAPGKCIQIVVDNSEDWDKTTNLWRGRVSSLSQKNFKRSMHTNRDTRTIVIANVSDTVNA